MIIGETVILTWKYVELVTVILFADWSPERVKEWIFGLFGDAVAQKFLEEEIDGRTLLESKRLEDDLTLEKLGITTIGKKERFKRELEAVRPVANGRYVCLLSKFHSLKLKASGVK